MKSRFFTLFFLSFSSIICHATHNRAGEITFRQVGVRTYEVTITTYTKSDAPADRCDLLIEWGDGSSSTLYRSNGTADRGCPYGGEPIYNLIKKNIYRGTHTYSTPGMYRLSMMDYNRNEGVKNIANSVGVPFYIESHIYVSSDSRVENSSPMLLNPPTDFGCIYTPFIHSLGAYDSDGDSLSYRLVNCRGLDGSELENTYNKDYNLDTSHISIDSLGTITWDSPNIIGEFNIAVEITEYRKDTHGKYYPIGKILRDMQIDITDCRNDPPVINAGDSYCVIAGDSITFDVEAYDINQDEITLSMVGGVFIGDNPATFTCSADSSGLVTGVFGWRPLCNQSRKEPYILTVKANDSPVDSYGNPLSGLSSQHVIKLTVLLPPPTLIDVSPSSDNDAIILKWRPITCGGISHYNIYRRNSGKSIPSVSCSGGIAPSAPYTLVGTTRDTTFIDSTMEKGLAVGRAYCYVVTAASIDSESPPSYEMCTTIPIDRPAICQVSIISTHQKDGAVDIHWSSPQEIDRIKYRPPYSYHLYNEQGKRLSIQQENDTTYKHTAVNTTEYIPLKYYVELHNESGLIKSSQESSSFYLLASSGDSSAILYLEYDVPWEIDSVKYYISSSRDNKWATVVIGDGKSPTRVSNLTNGESYTFYSEIYGHYEHSGIQRPIISLSQRVSLIPNDNEVKCPPQLSIIQDCSSSSPFLLHWTSPSEICQDYDIDSFYVYHRNDESSQWEEIHRTDTLEYEIPLGKRYGEYMVKARDSAGNVSKESNTVSVIHCENISLPNVFTPNGDGINDLFVPIVPIANGTFHIDIFSRWGQVVFSTSNPQILWDGTLNGEGKQCSQGVYFYVYSFTAEGESSSQKGSGYVHIFR